MYLIFSHLLDLIWQREKKQSLIKCNLWVLNEKYFTSNKQVFEEVKT